MAIFDIKNLSFSYVGQQGKAIDNLSLQIEAGGFYVICGKSGSGKSTLLRLLKREIAPNGVLSGEICYFGQSLPMLDRKKSASEIGFLCQDIDSQLVCDKVWKELSFCLGNLGYPDEYIASGVAEVSEYFGISKWYNKQISELSGGSKQIVAIASLMTTNPKVLLLDEPTSMMDPIAKKNFVALLNRIREELGVTIVIVEHNIESVFDISTNVVVLDDGKIVANEKPCDLPFALRGKSYAKYIGLTEFAEICTSLEIATKLPKTFYEKKQLIKSYSQVKNESLCKDTAKIETKTEKYDKTEIVLEAKNIWFRYEKKGADILSGVDFGLAKGEIVCIVGGNGGGKTTFVNVLTGVFKPYIGKVKCNARVALLPQNAKDLFVESTVQDEIYLLAKLLKSESKVAEDIIAKFELDKLRNVHPYDLSGGEVQRLALAKLFLTNPDIIILDEPTQGMDMQSKAQLKELLKEQTSLFKSVIIVTHDLRFASEIGDRVGLFFDGKILSLTSAEKFFDNNMLYTTESSLLTRDIQFGLYNVDKVVGWIESFKK